VLVNRRVPSRLTHSSVSASAKLTPRTCVHERTFMETDGRWDTARAAPARRSTGEGPAGANAEAAATRPAVVPCNSHGQFCASHAVGLSLGFSCSARTLEGTSGAAPAPWWLRRLRAN
ncbi:MAG: hypothetical protein ACPIOQ_74720, partial [Promethearchaeia archaeon]